MMGDERFDLEVVGLCWSHDKEGEEGVCGLVIFFIICYSNIIFNFKIIFN